MVRIRQTRWKVVYVAVAVTVIVAAYAELVPRTLPYPVNVLVMNAIVVAVVAVGCRSFRGRGEDVAAPRPWWRMTARPTAGFVIAALVLVNAAGAVVVAVFVPTGRPLEVVLNPAVDVVVGAFYLHSSIRLLRTGRSTRPGSRSDKGF